MKSLRLGLPMILVVAACGGTASTPTTDSVSTTAPPTTTATTTTTTVATAGPVDTTFVAGGLTLEATMWQGGTTWVVLGHARPGDKEGWVPLAEALHDAGFSVLTYNNRGYGDSEGSREPFALDADAGQAIQFAYDHGASEVVYGGASMNGANAMKLASVFTFRAVIVLSGVPSFPSAIDAIGALYEVDEPILFIAAEDDPGAVADLDSFLDRASGGEWIVLEQGGHGTDMLTAQPDLAQQIVDWLVDEIG